MLSLMECSILPFKHAPLQLETDEALLSRKVSKALKMYGVDVVVGNILNTRYDQVTVTSSTASQIVYRPENGNTIETALVAELVLRHNQRGRTP